MSGPDRPNEPEWPIRPDQRDVANPNRVKGGRQPDDRAPRAEETRTAVARKGNMTPILLALGGLVLLLFLAWLFTGNRSPDQDKLTGNSSEQAAASDPEKLCASPKTYDAIKRDLFRRAAQVRGSDQAVYDRLAAYASLRMENPVMESENGDTGAISCSGTMSLDLPPSVAVVGGRRTLSADVDYTVQPAADGSGSVVTLKNADAVITPLATLSRTSQPQAQQPAAPSDAVPGAEPMGPADTSPLPTEERAPPPSAQPEPARPAGSARPSFNCGNARTRGEVAVCSDAGLASLDRQMSAQFGRAISSADPGERALLQRTRNRFLSYRDSCRSDACIADAYRGRMREISDIMAGRWHR